LLRAYSIVGHAEFTGLADKNNKDIYEGDIDSEGYVVEFICGCFVLYNKDYTVDLYNHSDTIEIIGNIYENQDLLREEEASRWSE
jgi:hypothetical protein